MESDTKRSSDQWINGVLGIYFILGLIFAWQNNTWFTAIGVGSACLATYYLSKYLFPLSVLYQYVLSTVTGIFMVQFIYQTKGMHEMHFFAFIGSAILITYRNWKLQLPLLVIVTIHHGLFAYMQSKGQSAYFSWNEIVDFYSFGIHILLTYSICFLSGLWAYRFKISSDRQLLQTYEMSRLQKESQLMEAAKTSQEQLEKLNKKLVRNNEKLKSARLEAEKANYAKSIFLATMSHEIRTPLNGVIGTSALLSDTQLNEQQRIFIDTINSCSESLLTIISDILDFSKIEAGELTLTESDFSFQECLDDVVNLFAPKAAQKGLELVSHIDEDVPEAIAADKSRLQQILINLIGNAVKFTETGEVYIKVGMIRSRNQIKLCFEIRDTGIGIEKEKLNSLFNAFSQADASVARGYGGTGLGLTITERLLNLMGGKISVESEPNEGSVFLFSIPVKESMKKISKASAPDLLKYAGSRVLIVDDNATNRNILEWQLKNWQLHTSSAASAKEAFLLLTGEDDFDLILTDAQMPEKDGITFAREVRAIFPDLPIILLSSIGHSYDGESLALFRSILSKPIKSIMLMRHITDALEAGLKPEEFKSDVAPLLPGSCASSFPEWILVVEDTKVTQLVIMHLLAKLGYEADLAENGQLALDAMTQKNYNLVLMDIQMPVMDGLEATKMIRGIFSEQPIIIAVTANALTSDREDCLNAGMDDFISKPVKPELLKMKLEYWFHRVRSGE